MNKMTSYNLAVTLGPNIFRAEVEEADLASHANFYQAFIKLVDDYEHIFEDSFDVNELGDWRNQSANDNQQAEEIVTERVNYDKANSD